MPIKPIKTRKDYKAAVAEVEALWGAPADTEKGDRLDVLITLVDAYEEKHFPIDAPDPVEAIKFRMEQMGAKQKDLAELFNSPSRASEVLNRRRQLTTDMIWNLFSHWNIPAASLIRPYELKPKKQAA